MLIKCLGGKKEVVEAVIRRAIESGKLPGEGQFEIYLEVVGFTVVVRGRVMDDVVKLGTFYIP